MYPIEIIFVNSDHLEVENVMEHRNLGTEVVDQLVCSIPSHHSVDPGLMILSEFSPKLHIRVEIDELLEVILSDALSEVEFSRHSRNLNVTVTEVRTIQPCLSE